MFADFDEMVEHDVRWGQMYVDFAAVADRSKIAYMDPILARGLASICSLQACTSYDSKASIMCPDEPRASYIFLYHALEAANGSDNRINLEDYTPYDYISNIPPPYFEDPDSGSEDVWRFMHEISTRAYFINGEEWTLHRKWGYVMWDRSTLDDMGIFDEEWDLSRRVLREEGASRELRMASFKRREEIYRAGGRGWWSFEDESRIVWPDGKEP